MMLYYNGERLPQIPVNSEYPYSFIYRNPNSNNEYEYRCILSRNRYFYQQDDQSLRPGSNTVINYWVRENPPVSDSVWEERDTTTYYYADSENILWNNYDIHIDSQSGSNVWKSKSVRATLSDIFLIQQGNAYLNPGHTSLEITIENCIVDDILLLTYAVRGANNAVTVSPDWTELGGGNNASDANGTHQQVFFAMKRVEAATETIRVTQTGTDVIYAVYGEYANVKAVSMRNDLASKGNTDYTVTGDKQAANDIMLYATSSAYYGSGQAQRVTPDDIEKLYGWSAAERLAAWYDSGAGVMEHAFTTYTRTGAYDAIMECVQLFPYDRRYLIRSGGIYYTIENDTLTPLQGGEETEAFFLAHGVDEQPDDSFLSGLIEPEMLLWSNYPNRKLRMSGLVTAVPFSQTVYSPVYDMTDPTILGIETVLVDASDDALFAVSFDGGDSWKMHTGTAWATLSESDTGMSAETMADIPPEVWSSVATTGSIRIRATLPGKESYVGTVIIDYLN